MPKLMGTGDDIIIPNSNFKFSTVKIDELENSQYTVVTLAMDISGSLSGHENNILETFRTVVKSTKKSATSESIILRAVQFDHNIHEIHGFIPVNTIDEQTYYQLPKCVGGTALYDAIDSCVQSVEIFCEKLHKNNFITNSLIIIATDGYDQHSKYSSSKILRKIEDIKKSEKIESIQTILIGMNETDKVIEQKLKSLVIDTGIDNYVKFGDLTENGFAKMANFISRSISSSSQALGTGGPSQLVSLTI